MKRTRGGLTVSVFLMLLAGSARTHAESGVSSVPAIRIEREVGAIKNLALETGQNRLLVLSEPIGRVSVADPRIADLKVITPMQLLLTSRGVGTTDLTLWNKRDEPLVLSLQVTRNLERLKTQLAELFPDEKISVSAAGDLVVLTGEVSDVRVPERAAEVAQLHAEKVANLIKVVGNQQVQLEVKFAEVSRSGLRELGINFFHQDVGGRFLGGIASPGQVPDASPAMPSQIPYSDDQSTSAHSSRNPSAWRRPAVKGRARLCQRGAETSCALAVVAPRMAVAGSTLAPGVELWRRRTSKGEAYKYRPRSAAASSHPQMW